jgi:hypothetical protein
MAAAIGLGDLDFGVLCACVWVFLFGELMSVTPASWIWLIGLNGRVGTARRRAHGRPLV